MLFSFSSQYYYAIGLETYLGLGVDAPVFQLDIQPIVLWKLPRTYKLLITGLSPSEVLRSRRLHLHL